MIRKRQLFRKEVLLLAIILTAAIIGYAKIRIGEIPSYARKDAELKSTESPGPNSSSMPGESETAIADQPLNGGAVPTLARAKSSSGKRVIGFTTYYHSGDVSSYNSMQSNLRSIDEITTHTYIVDKSGNIGGTVPKTQLQLARNKGVGTYAMVSNDFSGSIAKSVLENPSYRQALVSNIISNLKAHNYMGVNIDFEGVQSSNRTHLTQFMKELSAALRPLGYGLDISVPAKITDNPKNAWSYAYDYAALGRLADRIILMTYDEHYPNGTAGPVASINWVQSVLDYALSVIPRQKIILGVAAYGYDWYGKTTKALSINNAYNLASKYNAEIKWDGQSKSSYFKYTDEKGAAHEVWFENSKSLSYKLDLVNSKNISGIAVWRIGLEDSDYWNVVSNKFN